MAAKNAKFAKPESFTAGEIPVIYTTAEIDSSNRRTNEYQ